MPAFGIEGAGFFAAALGLAVASAALVLDRLDRRVGDRAALAPAPAEAPVPGAFRDVRFALTLYAVAGGVALGYEVVWSEMHDGSIGTRRSLPALPTYR